MGYAPWMCVERKEINSPGPMGKDTSPHTATARGNGEVWKAPEMPMLEAKRRPLRRGAVCGLRMGGFGGRMAGWSQGGVRMA